MFDRLKERGVIGPAIGGHRGAGKTAPENTLPAFARGVAMGAAYLELDVQLSADGVPVVIHDFTLERTTNGRGFVGAHTAAALHALDAGSWHGPEYAGATIPTLAEVLDWARGRACLALEIKTKAGIYAGLEEATARAVAGAGMERDVLVMSFHHAAVRRLTELLPGIHAAAIIGCGPIDPIAVTRAAGADTINMGWHDVTPEVAAAAHAAGMYVQCPCNEVAAAGYLRRIGVDIVDTDVPEQLLAALRDETAPAPVTLAELFVRVAAH